MVYSQTFFHSPFPNQSKVRFQALNPPISSLLFQSGVSFPWLWLRFAPSLWLRPVPKLWFFYAVLVTVLSKTPIMLCWMRSFFKALATICWLRSFPRPRLCFAGSGPFLRLWQQFAGYGPFQGSGYTLLVTVLPKALVTIRSTTCNIVLHKC